MRYGLKKLYNDVVEMLGSDKGVTMTDNVVVMNPTDLPDTADWKIWVQALRFTTYFNQSGNCGICGEKLGRQGELHHALISKQDVRHTRDGAKYRIIHHSFNVVLCHNVCHMKATRRACMPYLKATYGFEEVDNWYNSVPSKALMRGL